MMDGDRYRVGNITHSTGVAIGRGARVTINQTNGSEGLAQLFAQVYAQIEARPETPDIASEEIVETVGKIETEAANGEAANPDKVRRWLLYLGTLAPDILEITLAALVNPLAGVAAALRKVAELARDELDPGLA
jgi:hypothetical protein